MKKTETVLQIEKQITFQLPESEFNGKNKYITAARAKLNPKIFSLLTEMIKWGRQHTTSPWMYISCNTYQKKHSDINS